MNIQKYFSASVLSLSLLNTNICMAEIAKKEEVNDVPISYEKLPLFKEEKFFEISSGTNYQISTPIKNNGFMNVFSVSSELLNVDVIGNDFAIERTHEIDVIYAMKEIEQSEAFMKGFDETTKSVFNATEKTIEDPIKALGALQKGIDNFLYDINASMSQMGSESSDDTLKDLIGLTQAKRDVAVEFNVDPYSSNTVLQEHLDKFATAVFYGGFTIKAGLQAAPGAASAVLTTAELLEQNSSRVWLKSPESLKMKIHDSLSADKKNKVLLTSMQESVCLVSHMSNIAGALIRIDSINNKNEIFKWALKANDEDECRRIVALSRLAWIYHVNNASLELLWEEEGRLLAKDSYGNKMIFLISDYLTWNATLDKIISSETESGGNRDLVVSGDVSAVAETTLENKGIKIIKNLSSLNRNIVAAEILFPDEVNAAEAKETNQTGELFNDAAAEVNNVVDGVFKGINSIFDGNSIKE